jgi:putative ABC transport system permease protein
MHESDVQELFQTGGSNDFLLRLADDSQRDETAKQLAQVLQNQKVVVLNVNVGHSDGGDGVIVNGLLGIMQVLSIIALLLSIFLLLSTITTLITEQLQVIGTMKAIGARRGQVMRNYLTSVVIYGVIGTILGLGLGTLLGYLLVNLFASLLTLDIGPLEISPSLVLLGAIIGLGCLWWQLCYPSTWARASPSIRRSVATAWMAARTIAVAAEAGPEALGTASPSFRRPSSLAGAASSASAPAPC